jgi:hypothetical protein
MSTYQLQREQSGPAQTLLNELVLRRVICQNRGLTHRWQFGVSFPIMSWSMGAAAGKWFRVSTVYTSMNVLEMN